jgi:hypothetical protein
MRPGRTEVKRVVTITARGRYVQKELKGSSTKRERGWKVGKISIPFRAKNASTRKTGALKAGKRKIRIGNTVEDICCPECHATIVRTVKHICHHFLSKHRRRLTEPEALGWQLLGDEPQRGSGGGVQKEPIRNVGGAPVTGETTVNNEVTCRWQKSGDRTSCAADRGAPRIG